MSRDDFLPHEHTTEGFSAGWNLFNGLSKQHLHSPSEGRINSIPLFIYLSNFTVAFEYIMWARALLGERGTQQCLLSRPQEQLHEEDGTAVPGRKVSSRRERNAIWPLTCCEVKPYFSVRIAIPRATHYNTIILMKCFN